MIALLAIITRTELVRRGGEYETDEYVDRVLVQLHFDGYTFEARCPTREAATIMVRDVASDLRSRGITHVEVRT